MKNGWALGVVLITEMHSLPAAEIPTENTPGSDVVSRDSVGRGPASWDSSREVNLSLMT